MKCICGYDSEYREPPPTIDYTYELEHPESIPKKFIKLDSHDYQGYSTLSRTLYACPKCGTVKVEL